MRNFFVSLLEVLEIAVIAVAAVFIVRTYLVQPFLVFQAYSLVPQLILATFLLVHCKSHSLHRPY